MKCVIDDIDQIFLGSDIDRFRSCVSLYRPLLLEGAFFSVDSLINFGDSCIKSGSPLLAVPLLRKAIELAPEDLSVQFRSAVALYAAGASELAASVCFKIIGLDESLPGPWCLLGQIEQDRCSDLDLALEYYRKALDYSPRFFPALLNSGCVHIVRGGYQAGRALFLEALEVDPASCDAKYNLARSFHLQGRVVDALALYDEVLSADDGYVKAKWNKSLCCLLLGDYYWGWRLHDSRFDLPDAAKPHIEPSLPIWQGEKLDSRSILLVSEQGFGDVIQFVRYVKVLVDRGLAVHLCVQPQLHALFVAAELNCKISAPASCVTFSDDCWLPLLSLPRILDVCPEDSLTSCPYLKPLKSHVLKWHSLLEVESMPVIGIHWQGSPYVEDKSQEFAGRSLPLNAFKPLVALSGFKLLSLQKGFGAEQLQNCDFANRFVGCQSNVDETWDFLETAAIIENCDLVVTSDSAVAHLSAAIGKPTWLLLKKVPDWRWGLESEQTFWYSSMRLFRQTTNGDWDEVIQRVVQALPVFLDELASSSKIWPRSKRDFGDERAIWWSGFKRRLDHQFLGFWDWVAAGAGGSAPHSLLDDRISAELTEARSDADRYLAAIYSLIEKGALDNAEILAHQALALSAFDHGELHCALALVLLRLGKIDEALERLELTVDFKSQASDSALLFAIAFYRKGFHDRASHFLARALELRDASSPPSLLQSLCDQELVSLESLPSFPAD